MFVFAGSEKATLRAPQNSLNHSRTQVHSPKTTSPLHKSPRPLTEKAFHESLVQQLTMETCPAAACWAHCAGRLTTNRLCACFAGIHTSSRMPRSAMQQRSTFYIVVLRHDVHNNSRRKHTKACILPFVQLCGCENSLSGFSIWAAHLLFNVCCINFTYV